MPNYSISVVVDYDYEVEADSLEEAEKLAWQYENFAYNASVYSVNVTEIGYEDDDED
jgi:hypothetical protein